MTKHKIGIFYGEPNEVYHSDNGFVSSSALKLILEDPIKYKAKYIDKTLKQEQKDAFDVGNAFHTKLLEPDKFDKEYAKFDGMKKGKKWTEFKDKNKNKTILGNKQWLEYELLVQATLEHPDSLQLLEGKSEVSIYIKLEGIWIKVRFDKLNLSKGFGMDLKSTTGLLIGKKGTYKCLQSIAGLDYDLSAALYLDAVNKILKIIAEKKGEEPKVIDKWYWIFASKDFKSCKILLASDLMLQNGRKKYKLAIELLKKYEASNWETEDLKEGIEIVDPLTSDLITDDIKPQTETW